MIANYHTHTARCHHAVGTEVAYIDAAIAGGLQVLGFSDHTPYPFADGYYSKMRMYPEELPAYMDTLHTLKKQYQDRIKIHAGVEAEYYPAFFRQLCSMLRDHDVEYMILGQHWLGNEQGEEHVMHPFEAEARLERYCDQTIEAMQTGVFSYVAHPDLPAFVGEEKAYRRQMRRLIQEAKQCKLPLEINLHGARCSRNYPDPRFWELVAEEGCTAVLGRDAHEPEEMTDMQTLRAVEKLVTDLGLTLLSKIPLIKP